MVGEVAAERIRWQSEPDWSCARFPGRVEWPETVGRAMRVRCIAVERRKTVRRIWKAPNTDQQRKDYWSVALPLPEVVADGTVEQDYAARRIG